MTKKVLLMLFLLVFIWSGGTYAVSDHDFVLNIVHDGYPVREIDDRAAIPFDDEYQIRLKNGHDRKCTAKVFIDGALVSKLGDFIIDSNGHLDLERFLDSSLTEGARFKFVRLSHPDVDDPSRPENGLIRVEFRLERKSQFRIKIIGDSGVSNVPPDFWTNILKGVSSYQFPEGLSGIRFEYGTELTSGSVSDSTVSLCSNTSSTAPGATVAGGESDQAFRYADIDVEDEPHVLELRIVGITEVSYLGWPPY